MQSKHKRQNLILVSIVLFVAFTFPIISIVNRPKLVAGIPVLFLYVLVAWITGIFIMYRIADHQQKKTDE